MGDHIAYYRTAPGEEELAFVRLSRALASKCMETTWYDSRNRLSLGKRQKGVKSEKRKPGTNLLHRPLNEILEVKVDSLSDIDLAGRLRICGETAENTFYFDAKVAQSHEVSGYLRLRLETQAYQVVKTWEPIRLWVDFRLLHHGGEEDEVDEDDLSSKANAIAFICGASNDKRPISQIKECIVIREGWDPDFPNIFSRYVDSTRDIVAQLADFHDYVATRPTAPVHRVYFDKESRESGARRVVRTLGEEWAIARSDAITAKRLASLQMLELMSDRELLKWYLDIANSFPRYRARKAGKGVMTSTTEPAGMFHLYSALLTSLD